MTVICMLLAHNSAKAIMQQFLSAFKRHLMMSCKRLLSLKLIFIE